MNCALRWNSSVAARQLFGPEVELACCASFAEAFEALERGSVAVLPFENSTAGLVPAVFERLVRGLPQLSVIDETTVSIRFVAAARAGATPIKRILAHPMAAAQCGRFLTRVGWQVIEAHDTAGAARLVSEGDDLATAALCPAAAAVTYGLRVVDASCGDDPKAVTRFFAVTTEKPVPDGRHDRALVLRSEGSRADALRVYRGELVELGIGGQAARRLVGERLIGSWRAPGGDHSR